MRKLSLKTLALFLLLTVFMSFGGIAAFAQTDQHIYDGAGLLSETEIQDLEAYASEKSRENGADFLLLTTDSTNGLPIETYMGNFFDEWADENGQENAVLLTIDMGGRNFYLAGFGTAETRLDNQRVEMVLDRITSYMVQGQYAGAFRETIETSDRYMEYRPGVNPESIFLKTWFHAAAGLVLAAIIVGSMLYNSGGRNTTTPATYIDRDNTRVVRDSDRFRNKTVTRRRIPKNNNSGGGFGGSGGMTGGGRSFSGGGRSF
ncbi:TPM domain-containing protein [Planococcus sp. CAU13]|uniref:TPM domain-containing protein n=1 Tax=Planococcus sp. CAU13 TaxID=1541197 RepID=UPI000A9696C0|nr:TPM domain-containing protein [Planococcus sp. CAU13]